MPHTNSAKKRLRQNARRRSSNRALRSQVRTVLRKAREAATKAPKDAATEQAIRTAYSELDKAARKGLLKKNEADRRKARLALLRDRSGAAK